MELFWAVRLIPSSKLNFQVKWKPVKPELKATGGWEPSLHPPCDLRVLHRGSRSGGSASVPGAGLAEASSDLGPGPSAAVDSGAKVFGAALGFSGVASGVSVGLARASWRIALAINCQSELTPPSGCISSLA